MEFSQGLISAAADMLAPLSGQEKYASVGGGHLVAFCRAALHGCKTPEVSLQDVSGNVDLRRLQEDIILCCFCFTHGYTVFGWLGG